MKIRTFIITICATAALVAPAAQAASTTNRLYENREQTVLWEKQHHTQATKARRVSASKKSLPPAIPSAAERMVRTF
jgi:hypothetical protein